MNSALLYQQVIWGGIYGEPVSDNTIGLSNMSHAFWNSLTRQCILYCLSDNHLIVMKHPSVALIDTIYFVYKCILVNINVASLIVLCLQLHCYIFHLFIFNLHVSLYRKFNLIDGIRLDFTYLPFLIVFFACSFH